MVPRLRLLVLATCVPLAGFAGGFDQSGQPVTALFEPGNRIEASLGRWFPEVTGEGPDGGATGNVYGPLTGTVASVKLAVAPRWSAAVILDRPFGVLVNYDLAYPGSSFPFAGTKAEPRSFGVTGLVRYAINERVSVHAGLRAIRFGTDARLGGPGFGALDGYSWHTDDDWGLGYVVGAAYEIPEIALRVALTYGSETEIALDGTESFAGGPELPSETEITLPQSVNLDFQTGLSPRILLYGGVRWADWQGWTAAPERFTAMTGAPLVTFDNSTLTYRLGLGRQFSERWAGSVEVTHETGQHEEQAALSPYDGYTSLGIAARYTRPSGLELAAGAAWYLLGDADVRTPAGPAPFRDNHAVGLGMKLSWTF